MSCIGLMLAAVLLWIGQGVLYQYFWKRGLSVSISFCQPNVVEGECAALTETIINAKYLPLTALHVKFQMGRDLVFLQQENTAVTDRSYRSDIFSCMPWQQIRRRLEFQCKKRGFYTIRQIDLTSYDLLWTSQFYHSLPADTAMYVYPAFLNWEHLPLPLRRLTGEIAARHMLLQDPFQLRSIRDYTSGDPRRDINWKATARTGSLKVNVHASASSWQVMLLLDGNSDRLAEDQELREQSIRLCATLAANLLNQGVPVAFCTNAQDCLTHQESFLPAGAGKHHLRTILELLARMDCSIQDRRPMEALIQSRFLHRVSGKAEMFEVSPSSSSMVFILVSPCQREALAAAYRVLCRQSPGSQWILPLRPGDSIRLPIDGRQPLQSLCPWEVPYER